MAMNGDGDGDGGDVNPPPPPPVDDVCAVCHDNFTLPCRTSCSHWFCGECILSVWRHGNGTRPCRCPLCNCRVTTLTPYGPAFDDQAAATLSIMDRVTLYNNRFHNVGVGGGGGGEEEDNGPHNAAGFFRRILAILWNAARISSDGPLILMLAVGMKLLDMILSHGIVVTLIYCAIAFVIIMLLFALHRAF